MPEFALPAPADPPLPPAPAPAAWALAPNASAVRTAMVERFLLFILAPLKNISLLKLAYAPHMHDNAAREFSALWRVHALVAQGLT